MNQDIPPRQPKYVMQTYKQAICHPQIMGWFSAILLCLLLIHAPRAQAQSPGNAIEQNFAAASLTPVPSVDRAVACKISEPAVEALMVGSTCAGHYTLAAGDGRSG